jgi:hypothetical protein
MFVGAKLPGRKTRGLVTLRESRVNAARFHRLTHLFYVMLFATHYTVDGIQPRNDARSGRARYTNPEQY